MNATKLMNEREAAIRLACKVSTLRKWRFLEKGPVYIQVGRLVRYSEADLIAFMDANRVQPTTAEVAR